MAQHSEKSLASRKQRGMFPQEGQLIRAISRSAPYQVRNRKRKMRVDGLRLGDVADGKSLVAQSRPEIRILRHAEACIERAGREQRVPLYA